MTSPAARHDLYTALRKTLGEQNADTLMRYLPSSSGEDLVNRAEVAGMRADLTGLRSEVIVEFSAVRGEMNDGFAAVRAEMKDEFAAVRAEMKDEFAAVRGEMATIRAETRAEFATFRQEIGARFESVDKRFDRAFIAQIASTIALFTAILAT